MLPIPQHDCQNRPLSRSQGRQRPLGHRRKQDDCSTPSRSHNSKGHETEEAFRASYRIQDDNGSLFGSNLADDSPNGHTAFTDESRQRRTQPDFRATHVPHDRRATVSSVRAHTLEDEVYPDQRRVEVSDGDSRVFTWMDSLPFCNSREESPESDYPVPVHNRHPQYLEPDELVSASGHEGYQDSPRSRAPSREHHAWGSEQPISGSHWSGDSGRRDQQSRAQVYSHHRNDPSYQGSHKYDEHGLAESRARCVRPEGSIRGFTAGRSTQPVPQFYRGPPKSKERDYCSRPIPSRQWVPERSGYNVSREPSSHSRKSGRTTITIERVSLSGRNGRAVESVRVRRRR
jgi:hypothetical protein